VCLIRIQIRTGSDLKIWSGLAVNVFFKKRLWPISKSEPDPDSSGSLRLRKS
jgi:hypothetical protein